MGVGRRAFSQLAISSSLAQSHICWSAIDQVV
jgi:hypothetical protein